MKAQLLEIGTVQQDENGCYIQLTEKYKAGLSGLEGFTHLNILWWGNLYDTMDYRENITVQKPYKPGPDQVGVFATRSPIRPNPVLITVIQVSSIDMEKGRIYTPYIDAETESPILDIKPYFPCSDIAKTVATPPWCAMLPMCIEDSATFDWSAFFNFES